MSADSERDALLLSIVTEEERLAALDRETQETQARIAQLRVALAQAEAARLPPHPHRPPVAVAITRTPVEKVALFRSLFRGRDDVYPRLWVNEKKGTKGYSPACANDFVRGVCEKPKVKCGECPNQAFIPVSDRVIIDHLQGRHVIGVYPLLLDETCWFLAADFDGESWRDDVIAFIETCRTANVPAAVERSRSGDGAHVWFFFSAPVAAGVARRMGSWLLTETMSRRHQLSMKSYDRLFPNQDTMPRGGFGNLIALPLQHGPRKLHNTEFLDDKLDPIEEQWAYLASVSRMAPAEVEAIAAEAARRGQVIGVRTAEPVDEDDVTPWSRAPSRRPRPARIAGPLPGTVRAVLAQRIFIEKEGLPSQLLNQIKRLAAFQNPEFYKKQSMRLSTALTPRVIACAEESPAHVGLPRGCDADLKALLESHGVALNLEDRRAQGDPIDVTFKGRLSPLQHDAARALLQHDIGVFVAPPGVGKTVLGTSEGSPHYSI